MAGATRFVATGIVLATLGAILAQPLEASAQSGDAAKVVDAIAARPDGTAERAAFYSAVASADVRGVDAMLERASKLSDPQARAFALDVLIARYSEIDSGGAVAAAQRVGTSPANLAPLYQAWFRSSPAAALASLAKLPENQASMIVPSLLARVQGDDELVAEILAAVPQSISDRYVASSISRLAQDSPREALERAQAISNPALRTETVNGVMRAWAQREPRAFLDYVATLGEGGRREALSSGSSYAIASSAPDLALDRADLFPEEVRRNIAGVAIQAIAQRDPLAAYARAQQMPQGMERRQLVHEIARSYAQRDANAALVWVRSLQPPEPDALVAVVTGIAEKDPLRAVDVAAAIGTPMEQQQAMQAVASAAVRDPSLANALLERVLALPDDMQRQSLVQSVVLNWASREPARAAEWMIANADRAPPNAVTQVASIYARQDVEHAASYAARVPSQARGAWLRGVANTYAATNPGKALDWVEQFRGSAEYDETAFAVIPVAARIDPEAAARAAESLGREDFRRSAIMQVASGWAQRDPARAANWAVGLSDQTSRMGATMTVAQFWSNQDPQAAQSWALTQPAGPLRDAGLLAVISTTARLGTLDDSLFAGISTEPSRMAALQAAAMGIAQRDPAAARAFIESHASDAAQRQRMLAAVGQLQAIRQGAGVMNPVTGALILPPPTPVVVCAPGTNGPCPPPGAAIPAFIGSGSMPYPVRGAPPTSGPPMQPMPAGQGSAPRPPPAALGSSSDSGGTPTLPRQ